jgi:hypothetical protein
MRADRNPIRRGLLYAHEVQVPSTAKKADLIKLFEDRVRPGAQVCSAFPSRSRCSFR